MCLLIYLVLSLYLSPPGVAGGGRARVRACVIGLRVSAVASTGSACTRWA